MESVLSLINRNMKNIVITKSGETIEVINGVLSCFNTSQNWAVIGDWSTAWEDLEQMEIIIEGNIILINFADSVPTTRILSLLEHFEYSNMVVDSLIKPEFHESNHK